MDKRKEEDATFLTKKQKKNKTVLHKGYSQMEKGQFFQ